MLSRFISVFLLILISLIQFNCKKDTLNTTGLASLKIVNAVTGGIPVRLGNYQAVVSNNESFDFSLLTGNLEIYVWPVGDSLHPYYDDNKRNSIADKEIYTLFIGGVPANPEGILINEKIADRIDSTAGLRFVNLSPDSGPVNITLAGSPSVYEFSNLAYKEVTEFKSFSARATDLMYELQVRPVSNPDTVLASFVLNDYNSSFPSFIPRFRNVTLVFNGQVSGGPLPRIIRVNHYPVHTF